MASPGLLFLLLVSSSLLLFTVSDSMSPTQNQWNNSPQKVNKLKEATKATGKFILANIDQIRFAVTPFLALIPVCGPLIAAITTSALLGVSVINNSLKDNAVLDAFKSEFESLNMKLDKYHVEQKWNSWASAAYQKPEKNIKGAWKMYEALVPSLFQARNDNERMRLKEEIIKACSKAEPAITDLHTYLTAGGTTFINNLGKSLADHAKCHEQDIREYTVFISKLIYQGITMTQLYYNLKEIKSQNIIDKEAEIAYDSASVMFQIQKFCIFNSTDYIVNDVKWLIDNTKREELAKKVRSFLQKTYDRYDWMVVAFITKHSKHKVVETLNKHVLSGFMEVTKDKVSVAVARQVKGTHTKSYQVEGAIKRCISNSVLCYKVEEKLRRCGEYVAGIPVSQTYTAVHAFISKAHQSHSDPEIYSDNPPYIVQGVCEKSPGVKGGKFVVLVKSDEEITSKDPCSKLNCGGPQRGTCVRVENTFVALCECKQPYYGQNCEHSLQEYKNYLQGKIEPVVRDYRPLPAGRDSGPRTIVVRNPPAGRDSGRLPAGRDSGPRTIVVRNPTVGRGRRSQAEGRYGF
uniref:uncharacterized protein LOC124073953 n=1 Tax=Scatophagus argus TaxID=75038 RepID=UPI001ED80177|nr:uncharacterized protein LOC124073953 [Scatophagus argus]